MMSTMLAFRIGQGRAKCVPILKQPSNLVPSLSACRNFSSDGGNPGGGGRGGGGRGGRGRRGSNNNNDWRGNNNNHGRRPKKPNYSEQFFEPPSRGELKNHRSGIPKLAGRKAKGHGIRSADPDGPDYEEEFADGDDIEPTFADLQSGLRKEKAPQKFGTIAAGDPLEKLAPEEYKQVKEFMDAYEQLKHIPDVEPYYWNERDYDGILSPKEMESMGQLLTEGATGEDDKSTLEADDDIDNEGDPSPKGLNRRDQPQTSKKDSPIPDIFEYVASSDNEPELGPDYDTFTPLEMNGPDMEDFALSMLEHPTRYAQVRDENPHPDSRREPRPRFPKNRTNPPPEFVYKHRRFLYVSGLPPLIADSETGDLRSPVPLEFQKTIADQFGAEPEQVSPASSTSAFIGFDSREDQLLALNVGPMKSFIESPVKISKGLRKSSVAASMTEWGKPRSH